MTAVAARVQETIVGRARELTIIHRAMRDTASGAGGQHVIFGPPGIGKSRLLRAAGDYAAELQIAVAAREAFRHDLAAPLVTLAGALRACHPAAAEFSWLPGAEDRATGNYARISRLRESLERYAAERPLLIVIDDAHWMDELSALAVRELIPACASTPVRWVLAGRPEPADSPGSQTLRWLARRTPPLRLGVLGDEAVRQLCEQVVGAPVDNTVLTLVAGCDGSPLRVEQLLYALLTTAQIVIADGTATVVGDDLPSSFVATVREIADTLSPDSQWLLRAASVLDRPFGVETAARLMGRPATRLLEPVDEVTASGLLVEGPDGWAFKHDLVRQALRSTLGVTMARHLHREAAELAREQRRPPAEIAGHLLHSGPAGTPAAVEMLRGTAAAIATDAPAAAADLMTQALHRIAEHDPDRPAAIAETVTLLASAGRVAEAHELGAEALRAGLEPPTTASLQLGLAEAMKHAGQNGQAARYAGDGLTNRDVPPPVRARLHAVRAHATFYLDDLTAAEAAGAEADRIGRDHEPAAAVFGLTARSLVAQAEGRLTDALSRATAATELADRAGGGALHRHPRIWLANALLALDRFDEAEAALARARQETDRLGTAWARPLLHYYSAALLTARGQVDDAMAEADAGVTVAEQLTAVQLAVPLLGTLTGLAVLRGDLDQARGFRGRMKELMATGISAPPEDVTWPEAMLVAAGGSPGQAFEMLTGLAAGLAARPALLVQHPEAAGTLVRLARAAGDPARAAAVVDAAQRLAQRNPRSHAAAGAAAHAAGLWHDDRRQLRLAVTEFGRAGRPLAVSAAFADAASGRDRPARDVRPTGEAPGRPPLTAAERSVAVLVTQGLTNTAVGRRLHISPHTVDSHLRKIFAKLDIHSRVELATVVTRERGDNRDM